MPRLPVRGGVLTRKIAAASCGGGLAAADWARCLARACVRRSACLPARSPLASGILNSHTPRLTLLLSSPPPHPPTSSSSQHVALRRAYLLYAISLLVSLQLDSLLGSPTGDSGVTQRETGGRSADRGPWPPRHWDDEMKREQQEKVVGKRG